MHVSRWAKIVIKPLHATPLEQSRGPLAEQLPSGVSEIKDARRIMHLRHLLNVMIEYPSDIRRDFVEAQRWAICPVADQPSLVDCERICAAATLYDTDSCFLVSTETRSFRVVALEEMRFSKKFAQRSAKRRPNLRKPLRLSAN